MEEIKCSNQSEYEDLYFDAPENEDSASPASSLRRRRSFSGHVYSYDSTNFCPSRSFENYLNSREKKKLKFSKNMIENAISENSTINSHLNNNSEITVLNNSDTVEEINSNSNSNSNSSSSILLDLVNLVIKYVSFQVNLIIFLLSLMIKFFTLPMWLIYSSYIFVMDPFRITRRVKRCFTRKFMNSFGFVFEWLKDNNAVWLKFGGGCLWSVYVCVVLVGLLVFGFIIGGIFMRIMVEQPIWMKENLNFDYTVKSPVAFVPVMRNAGVICGVDCEEGVGVEKVDGVRVIPPNHRSQVTVLLTLPESDYNRNLGIFQVRVDFLAAHGKVLASLRRPCMLHFKSHPIRLLSTFLKAVPLVTGYISESQNLKVDLRGYTEGNIPTACLRVMIEQRAEFQPKGGIPEMYAASLTLESELPLLKRIIWYWKTTLFVWLSMTIFTMELFFALICCKPLIIPKVRLTHASNTANASRNNQPIQR